jgi:hypothetical protein
LFNSVWIGNAGIIYSLRERLLPAYFQEDNQNNFGRSARELYLERLEQDLLQYRLMHKGYERHFPINTLSHLPHAELVDGSSAFWDSGYRQIATKLFVNSVFLPKIGEIKT